MAEEIANVVIDLATTWVQMKIFDALDPLFHLKDFAPLGNGTAFIMMNLLSNMTTSYQPIENQELGGYNIRLDIVHLDPGSTHAPRFANFDTDLSADADDNISMAQWTWRNATRYDYQMNFTGVYTDDLGEMLITPEPDKNGVPPWFPNGTVFGQDSAGVWFGGTWTTQLREADFLAMAWRNQSLPEAERWKMTISHPVRKPIGPSHCGKHHCSNYKGPRPPLAVMPGVEHTVSGAGEEEKKEEEYEKEEEKFEGETSMPEWVQKCFETPEAMACLNAAIEGILGNASKIKTGPM